MRKFQHALLYKSIFIALSSCAYANELGTNEEVITLDTVNVKATSFSQQIGTQKVTEEQISRRPTKGGGITDLLKSNPNVRFSNESELSKNAGEIAPNEVSFHGEKHYNNNFVLDGMSNNDNINPSGNLDRNGVPVGSNPYDLPNGNAQSMWIDAGLLKSVEAFDSNVSAKYGSFTGGVVDAKLKDPSFERRTGKIYYRTTRDDWTQFYIQEGEDEKFKNATRLDYQPKFVKQTFGIQTSEKLAENFSLLFSYERTQSDIDHYHNQMRYKSDLSRPVSSEQRRLNETYLVRGVYLPENGDLWRGTLIYSPHSSRLFKQNVKNGKFTATGGGTQANLEWEKRAEWGKITSYIGYKRTGDEIQHEERDYHRYAGSSAFDWKSNISGSYATFGGYGKYLTEKEIYTLKQDYELSEFDWKGTEHKVTFGWKADFAHAKYERDGVSSSYFYKADSKVICGLADTCLDGDQYATTKNIYEARRVNARDTDYSAYLQDTIKWKNLELTLGARLSHNQFLGNTDLAHRVSTSYDLFGDQSTMVFGGFNRYYGTSMLAYKLRQGIGTSVKYTRALNVDNTLADWINDGEDFASTKYYHSKVRTPYADEKVLGITQRALDSNWTLKWVHRNSRDQFSSAIRVIDGTSYRVLNNDGSTENDTFTLSISPLKRYEWEYAVIGWDAGARISRTYSNNKNYDTSTDLNAKAIYNGKLIDAVDLPPNDFNTPWSAFINLNMHFPKLNLSWDHRFSYTHGRKTRVSDHKISCNASYAGTDESSYAACGNYVGDVTVYEDLEMGNAFNVDWRFTYKQPTFQNQFVEITLDVNNVLNRKELSQSLKRQSSYKQGRNFWLGASYHW